ncbi:transient receptor potential-gamma protein-like [Tubulanus polymorphus]|uniref:transient receptor potential-gamma protein-like n=1 Tax=Tubulanus polymorphus TaxID=672921 RepID=UPI003DA5C0E8
MDKVYKEYKKQMNPEKLMQELGIELNEGSDTLGMGVIRKEIDLTNEERQYLLAVERGDMARARNFLDEAQIYFNININCVDPLGRTALHIAIENENIEMIEVLLSYNVELADALLHAINEENVEAVELLLSHQSQRKGKDLSGFLGGYPSTSFTPDITPIILAAHKDNYEVIKILLDRGDKIPKPHDVRCSCKDCIQSSSEDSLCHSRSRINAYRALASPSLIALSSKDPILTAFELSWELKRLSRLENEFKNDYEELAKQCQEFATALLEQTRGSHELQTVLNHDTEGPVANEATGNDKMTLSRLKLAIKYKQKTFVSHPHCQQLLASLWYEGLLAFRRRMIITQLTVIFGFAIGYPFLSMVYLVAPKSKLGTMLKKPFIKFICHTASYMMFLFLLILVSQRMHVFTFFGDKGPEFLPPFGTTSHVERRGSMPSIVEMFIVVWVIGFLWTEVKTIWKDGGKAYILDMMNLLDFVTNSLYVAMITLRVVAFYKVYFDPNPSEARTQVRMLWDAFEPTLVAESLFAAANIFSSLKLVYIFTMNPHLGPLQISIGRMVVDIMKFCTLYFLVLFSFSCGLNHLYWYYAKEKMKGCNLTQSGQAIIDNPACSPKNKYFANLFEIAQTLYWALYGLVELDSTYLQKEKHIFTEFVGKLMFGSYCFISVIVLLNMLIAMMSNSYQQISEAADMEWKFARSKLWISYFEEGGTLPVPFNIIPSPKSVLYLFRWFKDKLCSCTTQQKRSRWQSIRKIVKKVNEREARYQQVIKDLIKRYIMARQRSTDNEGVTEDDLNEIKQDISAFRYELLEILRNNGMKTPNYGNYNKPTSGRLRRKRSQISIDRIKKTIDTGGAAGMDTISEEGISSTRPGSMRRKQEMDKSKDPGDVKGNGIKPISIPTKIDEGLGDSMDQSENLEKKSGNPNDPSEIQLDPSKLPGYKNGTPPVASPSTPGSSDGPCTPETPGANSLDGSDSPFSIKRGHPKKVSFSWNSKAGEQKEPYVYDGKPNGNVENPDQTKPTHEQTPYVKRR